MTEARVGKFYVGGKEIKWDSMVETKVKEVYEKDREVDQENNKDVVIEPESGPNKPEIKTPEKPVQAAVKSTPVVQVPPTTKLSSSPPKLIRMVPPVPFELLKEVPVFIVHVESTKRIWVCREDDEVRVSLMMDKLARMVSELKSAQRMKRGAVYGASFSQDGAMYRAVLKEVDGGILVVQFIDFGNKETKEERELFDIPEEIGSSPAAAVVVNIKNDLEETEENRIRVEDLLEGDILTVTVVEDGAVFKLDGREVQFSQNTSEEITLGEIKKDFDELLPEAETTTIQLPSEPPSRVLPKEKATPPPAASVNSKSVATTGLADQPEEVAAVTSSPAVPTVPAHATVAITPAVVPQPVPTRTFAKAISALQSQLLTRPRTSTGESKDSLDQKYTKKQPQASKVAKEDASLPGYSPACQWTAGDQVVAKWPDGVWRQATIVKMDTIAGQAMVVGEGVKDAIVSLLNVRPHSLPVEALNLIDQGLMKDSIVRQKGDGATCEKKGVVPTVVGKVKEWMDKNMTQFKSVEGSIGLEVQDQLSPTLDTTSKLSLEQIPLPPCQELAVYSRTNKGSLHIQSVLNSSNPEQCSLVLSSLLTSSPGPLSLITSPKSSYVIQKLITVLPCSQLQPLLFVIHSNFTHLSMDSSGCRVVQSMLEFSSHDQRRSITSLLCNTKTLLTLAGDRHGIYVAQACLPHLTPCPTSLLALVNSIP